MPQFAPQLNRFSRKPELPEQNIYKWRKTLSKRYAPPMMEEPFLSPPKPDGKQHKHRNQLKPPQEHAQRQHPFSRI